MAEPNDPDVQLEELCRVLNYFGVGYIVFGSHVARFNGVPLETVDVDVGLTSTTFRSAVMCGSTQPP